MKAGAGRCNGIGAVWGAGGARAVALLARVQVSVPAGRENVLHGNYSVRLQFRSPFEAGIGYSCSSGQELAEEDVQ